MAAGGAAVGNGHPAVWRLLVEEAGWGDDPAANVAVDTVLSESVGSGLAPATLRVWPDHPCLVVGWGEGRLPHLAEAAALLRHRGLPLLRRHSGGQAVLHGPGHLNFTACLRLDPQHNLSHDYRRLLEPFMAGLRALGVPAGLGEVPGAYCVGRYDMAAGGRKLAGTAQARRRGSVLVHGTLLVGPDLAQVARVITDFYAAAGVDRPVDAATLTSVSAVLGRSLEMVSAAAALLAGWRAAADLELGRLLPWERERLPALAAEVRYPWNPPA